MASTEIPLVGPIIQKIFGTTNQRAVRRYTMRVDDINALEDSVSKLTDPQLRAKTDEFRERIAKGQRITDVMDEALAIAREAMDRNVGIRNIFNPLHAERFQLDKLPENAQRLYRDTKAAMDAAEPRDPTGDLLGNTEPIPAWMYHDIPLELYNAVRDLYPHSKPPFRARPFDVQLIGAIVLYSGKIAEMKTGEGKTIVAPLATYLAVLEGLRVHVVTVNDYLVQRDRDWVFPFHRALGITVGAIHPQHMQPEDVKRTMYACDVVYGTTSEFGFDYLRDNMKRHADQQVQRVREFAIVDEVDSTLVDEARTPLIISGPAHEDSPRYDIADQLARHLVQLNKAWDEAEEKVDDTRKRIKGTEGDIRTTRDRNLVPDMEKRLEQLRQQLPNLEAERDKHPRYYEVERDKKQVTLTHSGIAEAQKRAGVGSFYVGDNTDLPHLLQQALRAHVIYELDVDYVVVPSQDPMSGRMEPDVVIVDTNTGRPMVGRQWSDGLHQAMQAKEGLRIRQETQTVASITIQNFFKMYKRLAGMTGTADTEAQEFHDIYKLEVVVIPTNVPVVRNDYNDVVYLTQKDKWDSIVEEIKAFHDTGRPILVGTTSVEKSEMLSRMLASKHKIKHEVLNAKQHEREAHIVENAGALGAVMIATNMAGRGTDIRLQRISREQQLDFLLRRGLAPRELSIEDDDATLRSKVYRKIAPRELTENKREVESMSDDEIELALLRKWVNDFTWADPKKIDSLSIQQMREMLDDAGRTALHAIRWVDSTEQLGGLHVIGTERHESRRIDNQLRGRSGRQGDRGSSRFFVSLDDDLMKLFAGPTTLKLLSQLGMKEGDAIEHPMLSKAIVKAQRKVEERNFQIRKNILEYDEIMEHQRQDFYSVRQRVLDGRDIRGLIFEYIEDAALTAVERYLEKGYKAECVALYASEQLSVSIPMERLRGRDDDEIVPIIHRIAKEEARAEIGVTIGEYIPDEANIEDIDTAGLTAWAESRYGAKLTSDDVLNSTTKQLADRIEEAADQRIDHADLSGIAQFTVPNFGEQALCDWLRRTMDLNFTVDDITKHQTREGVIDMILDRVTQAYDKREVEYPVDFMMELTMALMRQNPLGAAENLVRWANTRFNLDWTPESIRTTPPQKIREQLVQASRDFVNSDRIAKATEEALAIADDDKLEAHLKEKFNAALPLWMRRLKGEERDNAIRARIQGILRSELVWFEQTILLQVLDPIWKDHLYGMDQLRDTITYRAFSQQDPRIEYKREGSRLFSEMMNRIRDRVTELVFRARVMPQVNAMPQQRPQQRTPQQQAQQLPQQPQPTATPPQQSAAGALRQQAGQPFGSSSFSGPGFNPPSQ